MANDALFTIQTSLLAIDDSTQNSNPLRRYFDWVRSSKGVLVSNPSDVPYSLTAGETQLLFSGVRTLSLSGSVNFSLLQSTLSAFNYVLTAPSVAVFRTERVMTFSGTHTITATVNTNGTLLLTANGETPFGAALAGDAVFIPGVSTGDGAGPFDELNVGYWVIVQATSGTLLLKRPVGLSFVGVGQTTTNVAVGQLQVFSSAGVQPGDSVALSGAFLPVSGTFQVLSVTAHRVIFSSTEPLATFGSVSATSSDLQVYSKKKSWIWVEADQPCTLIVNGLTYAPLKPKVPGDKEKVATFHMDGDVFSLSATNLSTSSSLNLKLFAVE